MTMEFLLTYGWAIVAGITLGAALWYYGLIDSTGMAAKYLPSYCRMDTGLSCLDHDINYVQPVPGFPFQNELRLILKNEFGETIRITHIEFPSYNWVYDAPDQDILSQEQTSSNDLSYKLDVSKIPLMEPGTPYYIEFILIGTNLETSLEHRYKGAIRGKIS